MKIVFINGKLHYWNGYYWTPVEHYIIPDLAQRDKDDDPYEFEELDMHPNVSWEE